MIDQGNNKFLAGNRERWNVTHISPPMSPPSFRLATDRVDHKGIIGVINKVIREITSFWLATDRG